MAETDAALRRSLRPGHLALWDGILFSLVFAGVIWWAGQRLASIPHLPDTGPSWYYWKLPEPTLWSRVTAWGFYALHQVSLWALIFAAQNRAKRYTAGLHRVNTLALGSDALIHRDCSLVGISAG